VCKITPGFRALRFLKVGAYRSAAAQELVAYAPARDGWREGFDQFYDSSAVRKQSFIQVRFPLISPFIFAF